MTNGDPVDLVRGTSADEVWAPRTPLQGRRLIDLNVGCAGRGVAEPTT